MNRLIAVLKRPTALFATVAAALLIACGVWAETAQAQSAPGSVPFSENSRALIRNDWNNVGISGGNPDVNRGGSRNDYPNNGTGPGSYGTELASTGDGASQHYNGYRISGGEGIWILTGDGKISVTGPRFTAWVQNYIRPVPYDPKGNPEEKWGVPNPLKGLWKGGGSEPALSNYWPGVQPLDLGSLYFNKLDPDRTPPALIANYELNGYIVDPTIPEETIIARWTNTKQGITTTRRVYNWSNPDFDDFYIWDLTFTNNGDFDGDGKEDKPGQTKTQENVYIAFDNSEVVGALGNLQAYGWDFYVTPDGLDDIYFYTDAANYTGAFKGLNLKTSMIRDSDNPLTSWDDTGQPFYASRWPTLYVVGQTNEQLLESSTYGFAPIAYRDSGPSHTFNDLDKGKYVQPQGEQPYAARWWHTRSKADFDDPHPENNTEEQMRNTMFASGIKDNPNEANPDDAKMYVYAQVYGPYTLKPGESAKLVMVFAAGHPSQMRSDPKQGMGTMDIVGWDRLHEPLDKMQREFKTLGEQALLENIRLARFAYEANYQVPAAPTNTFIAADELTSSPNAHQQISWIDKADRAVNPYYKEQDVIGYRVYRSTWLNWGPWELWDVIEKGKSGQTINGKWTYANGRYTYEDLDSVAGFEYHYSVRPYARGHATWSGGGKALADIPVARVRTNVTKGYESGWGPSTARSLDGDLRRPFQPATAETDQLQRQVRVVPNPYVIDGKHQYPNSNYLRFVNVPRKCKIYIYSASGDRVQTIDQDETTVWGPEGTRIPKTDAQKGEATFTQFTWNLAGEIATGFYYFVVVSETPGSEGKIQRGAFVVIK